METTKIHYSDDFDFMLSFRDSEGQPTPLPECNFKLNISTGCSAYNYVVWRDGDTWHNCHLCEDGRLHVVCNNHRLTPGRLRLRLDIDLPDGIYPDGHRRIIVPEITDIELVLARTALPTSTQIEVIVPYIKGKDFNYDDLTEEQLTDLKNRVQKSVDENNQLKDVYDFGVLSLPKYNYRNSGRQTFATDSEVGESLKNLLDNVKSRLLGSVYLRFIAQKGYGETYEEIQDFQQFTYRYQNYKNGRKIWFNLISTDATDTNLRFRLMRLVIYDGSANNVADGYVKVDNSAMRQIDIPLEKDFTFDLANDLNIYLAAEEAWEE